ncbi:Fic family protein [Microbacterium sp. M1A1_1b]
MSRYEDTPVSPDDAVAFVEGVDFDSKAAVDAAEDAALTAVLSSLLSALDEGLLSVPDLLLHGTLQDLHQTAFEHIWDWAGRLRTREVSVGVAPDQIREQLRATHDDLDLLLTAMPPREFAMTAHWRFVRVHPFVDGNGRITRLYADAILFGLSGAVFDWQAGDPYYRALRRADADLSVQALLDLTPDLRPAD